MCSFGSCKFEVNKANQPIDEARHI